MHKVQYILRKRYSHHPILSIVIVILFIDAVNKKKNYPSCSNFEIALCNSTTNLITCDRHANFYFYKRIKLPSLITLNVLIDAWWYSYFQNDRMPRLYDLYVLYREVKLRIIERDLFDNINSPIWVSPYSGFINENGEYLHNKMNPYMLYNKCQQCRWYKIEPSYNEHLKKRVLCEVCKKWRTEYIFNETTIKDLKLYGIDYICPDESIFYRRE